MEVSDGSVEISSGVITEGGVATELVGPVSCGIVLPLLGKRRVSSALQ